MESKWKHIVFKYLLLLCICVGVLLVYLFNLQPMAPDSLQQVTEAGDECVLLHAGDADLTVTELHCLPAHLLHQHALCLDRETRSCNRSTTWEDATHRCTDPSLKAKFLPLTYLIPALLQQTLHKLPVGLSDDRRGQVGQFGLADGGAQVTSLLDVLLYLQSGKYEKI